MLVAVYTNHPMLFTNTQAFLPIEQEKTEVTEPRAKSLCSLCSLL